MSSRFAAISFLTIGLFINEWAFEFVVPTDRDIDGFLKLLVLVGDVILLDTVMTLTFVGKKKTFKEFLRFVTRTFPKISSLYFGLVVAYLLLLGLEFGSRYYFKHIYKAPYTEQTKWQPAPKVDNADYGYILPADTIIHHQYFVNDSLIFDYHYPIDQYSRRITPFKNTQQRNKFLIISGCSFAFGYGVDNSNTLAAQLAQELPHYRPYNYGVAGYGTQHTLIKLQNGFEEDEINEENGMFIYYFIDDHVNRSIGSRRILKLWGETFPFFKMEKDVPINKGTFKDGRPNLYRFYKILSQSAFIDLFNIDFPLWIRDKHLKLVAEMLEESKNLLKKKFPNADFVVVLAPGSEHAPTLKTLLEQRNIRVLDLSQLLNPRQREYLIHYTDRHPNATYYKEVAKEIISEIHKFETP